MRNLVVGLSCLLWLTPLSSAVAQAQEQKCQDPVFLQFEARMTERAAVQGRISGWREFVATYPNNPCLAQAQAILHSLAASTRAEQERRARTRWRQEARGGLIEPGRGLMPAHLTVNDPAPADHLRWQSGLVWLSDALAEEVDVAPVVWTQLLRLEYAPVPRLALSLDVPLVVGEPHSAGFDAALGNIRFGARAVWGTWLSGSRPLVLAGGFQWSSGSSIWSGEERAGLLDAAAFGAAHLMPMFRWDARDYAGHVEAQLGLGGGHHLSAGLLYRLQVGGEHVEKMARLDLAWDWRWAEFWRTAIECEFFGGVGEKSAAAAQSDWMWYMLPSAVLSVSLGSWRLATAVQLPLLDASKWGRVGWLLEIRRDL